MSMHKAACCALFAAVSLHQGTLDAQPGGVLPHLLQATTLP